MTSPLRMNEKTPRETANSAVRGFMNTLRVLDSAKEEVR